MMQVPDDYNAGPMSLQEFESLKADEEACAARDGYIAKVERVDENNQIFAKVTFSEENDIATAKTGNSATTPPPGQPAAANVAPVSTVAAAAMGAAAGAAIAGPLGAAGGAAIGVAAAELAGATASSLQKKIATAMQDAADQFDVDPKLLAAIAAAESNFNPTISNPNSSAFGLFQFLIRTWNDVVRKFGAGVGVNVSNRAEIRAQCLMGAAFLKDNQDVLRQMLGREPTDGDCYAAHFFGATTAARLLSGPPEVRADVALGSLAQRIISANESIFKQGSAIRTVGQVTAELARRVDIRIAQAITFLEAA